MKKLILIFFLLLNSISLAQKFSNTTALSNDSMKKDQKEIYLGINGGYRINLSSNPSLNSNGYFGFSIEIPFSEAISLQPEINFWKSKLKNSFYEKTISVIDLSLLLILNIHLRKSGFSFLFGLGIILENNSNDKLISFNGGGRYWIELSEILRLFSQIRFQTAGSLESGGGDSITSILLCAGLQIAINP